MKKNYSRGSVGGVILVVVGIVLCFLLLGVLVKTFKGGSLTTGFVPVSTVTQNSTTSASNSTNSTNTTIETQNDFVPATSECQMVITEPDDEDNVSVPVYFSGYLSGCGSVSSQMLLGSVTVYRYGSAEALAPSLTLKARESVRAGNVNFAGYIDIPNNTNITKGVMKFKHFLPTGGTDTQDRIIYF